MGKYNAFFYECEETVICKQCNWISRRRKDGSTAAVRHHLRTKHQDVFIELEENDRKRKSEMTEKVAHLLDQDAKRPSLEPLGLEQAMDPPALFKHETERRVYVPIRQPDDDKITGLERAIMQMICTAALSSSLVEDHGFINLLSKFAPNYKKQSSAYFDRNVLRVLYDEQWTRINALLAEASFVSISCHCHPSTSTGAEHITLVTAHFLDTDMKPRTAVISAAPSSEWILLEDRQARIAQGIDRFQCAEKVHVLIYEGASVKSETSYFPESKRLESFSHILSKSIECCLTSLPGFYTGEKTLKKRLLEISARLGASEFDQDALGECHYLLAGGERASHTKNDEMGWEAELRTLSYFLNIRAALEVFLADHLDYPRLDQSDWDMLQEIVNVLRPISTAVDTLQNQNYTPISVVIPLLKVVLGQLGEDKLPKTNFKQSIRLLFENTLIKYESIQELVLATLVDPRFKNAYFESEKRSLLVEKAAEILRSLDDRHSSGHNYAIVETVNSSNPFQSFLMEHKTAVTPGPYTHTARAAAEVDDYLSRDPSFSIDPFEYWKSDVICARYPCIQMLAMKYLSAPASTEYERLFPNVAVIHEEVRESYDSPDFEKLLFLHYNIPIFGFD